MKRSSITSRPIFFIYTITSLSSRSMSRIICMKSRPLVLERVLWSSTLMSFTLVLQGDPVLSVHSLDVLCSFANNLVGLPMYLSESISYLSELCNSNGCIWRPVPPPLSLSYNGFLYRRKFFILFLFSLFVLSRANCAANFRLLITFFFWQCHRISNKTAIRPRRPIIEQASGTR